MRKRIHHTAKWRRMVRAIKRRGGSYSPYAVATARLGPSRLKNPPSKKSQLAYLHKLLAWYSRNGNTHEANRIAKKIRKLLPANKNPFSSKTKRKALRIATKLAYHIYKDVKAKHFSRHHLTKHTPKLVRKYTKIILDANGIKMSMLKD
jgi:hypothetical protein